MGTCISSSMKTEKTSNASKSSFHMNAMKQKIISISSSCWVGERRKLRGDNYDSIKLEEDLVQTPGSRARTPVLPLWQRRILMGEKCELPRFSGLILYDERGFPLETNSRRRTPNMERHATAMITIKDLL
ncbi:hypothetical protein LUZ60_012683 [Juncus effusus]|nr:hypothetical protein LUZ60_012683 [Juncus effusus]